MTKSKRRNLKSIYSDAKENENDLKKLPVKQIIIKPNQFGKNLNIWTLLDVNTNDLNGNSYDFVFKGFPDDFVKFANVYPLAETTKDYDFTLGNIFTTNKDGTYFNWTFKHKWKKVENDWHLKVHLRAVLVQVIAGANHNPPDVISLSGVGIEIRVRIMMQVYNRRVWHEIQLNST